MYSHDVNEIKVWRKKLDLTQKDLANLSNVSQSLIAKIESNLIDPTYSKAKRIFETLEGIEKKEEKTVKDIMQKKLLFLNPNDNIKQAIDIMRNKSISQMPVIENENVLGIISEASILDAIIELKDYNVKVREIMSDGPPIVSLNTSVNIVSNLLKHYPLVVIYDKEKIMGIVTKADIINEIG